MPLRTGHRVEVQRQVLAFRLGLAGLPFPLCYRSDRVPGHRAPATLSIPLTGPTLPRGLRAVRVEVALDGRREEWEFPPEPSRSHRFVWDGRDAAGGALAGTREVRVRVGHVFPGPWPRPETVRWRETRHLLQVRREGWSPAVEHRLDRARGVLLPGGAREVRVNATEDQGLFYVPGLETHVFDGPGLHLRTLDARTGHSLWEFARDESGVRVADAEGRVTHLGPEEIVGPWGDRHPVGRDGAGHLDRVGDYTLRHSPEGLLLEVRDGTGREWRFAYDLDGRLVEHASPGAGSARLVRTEHDPGYQVSVLGPEGREAVFAVGPHERASRCCGAPPTKVLTRDGRRVVEAPDGTRAEREPVEGGSRTILATPGGLRVESERTVAEVWQRPGLLLRRQHRFLVEGRPWLTVYDGAARTLTTTTPAGRSHQVLLDERGRVAEVHRPGVEPLRVEREGPVTRLGQGDRVTVLEHDERGRLAAVVRPCGRRHAFAEGSHTLPDGREIRWETGSDGLLRALVPPGRGAWRFEGSPTTAVRPPEGEPTLFEYDGLRRPLRVARPDGREVLLRYGEGSRPVEMACGDERTEAEWDPATGRLLRGRCGGVEVEHGYDGPLLVRTCWSGALRGEVARRWGPGLRCVSLRVNGGPEIPLEHDPDGLRVRCGPLEIRRDPESGAVLEMRVGEVATRLAYDLYGQVAALEASWRDRPLVSLAYVRDPSGRVVECREAVEGEESLRRYGYGAAGRLEQAGDTPLRHDDNGNRVARGGEEAAFDGLDRLLTQGARRYEHTALGERSRDGETRLGWDFLGRLKEVDLADGRRVAYEVDAEGRRVVRRVDGARVGAFLYEDRLRPVASLDAEDRVESLFLHGPFGPACLERGGRLYAILTEPGGSVRLVVDAATGEVAQRLDYDESGGVLRDTAPGFQPFGFAGGLLDPDTGYVHFGARDYDPRTGRWLSPDPVRFAGGDTNLYSYCGGDPVNGRDRAGLFEGVFPGWGPSWHHDRNQYQSCPPSSPDLYTGPPECPMKWEPTGWKYEGRMPTHGNYHTYRNSDLGAQCVYDDDGRLVTDPEFEGTYDYYSPYNSDGSVNPFGVTAHFLNDVLPWILFGN